MIIFSSFIRYQWKCLKLKPWYLSLYNCIILFIIGYLKIEEMFTYYLPIVWSTQPSEEEGILNEILFKKIDKIFT